MLCEVDGEIDRYLGRHLTDGCLGLLESGVQLLLGQALVIQQSGESKKEENDKGIRLLMVRYRSGDHQGIMIVLEPHRLETLIGARSHSA